MKREITKVKEMNCYFQLMIITRIQMVQYNAVSDLVVCWNIIIEMQHELKRLKLLVLVERMSFWLENDNIIFNFNTLSLNFCFYLTGSQILDLQHDALLAVGVESKRIYKDLASGRKDDRPGLHACIKALQPGNTLVVWKLDRLRPRSETLDNYRWWFE